MLDHRPFLQAALIQSFLQSAVSTFALLLASISFLAFFNLQIFITRF
jgi:hypothetical protein